MRFLKSFIRTSMEYSSPPAPLSVGNTFQDPLWMPETEDSTSPHLITIDWNASLFMSCTHKYNSFSVLTKHFAWTVVVTFVVWGGTAKLANMFFLLQNSTDRRCVLTVDLSHLSIWLFFPLSQELSHFYLKEVLCGFSLAYPNFQHWYSCMWGLLLNEKRVTCV